MSRVMARVATGVLVACALAACGSEQSGPDYGAELFHSPTGFSDSTMNPFSCADCHRATAAAEAGDDRIVPGATLFGVAARQRWWGGQSISLADAVNTCVVYFLRGQPLDPASDRSRALHEYLQSITPAGSPTEVVPMTVVENISAIPLGDATRGADLYRRACQYCHGDVHTGAGNILLREVILPDVEKDYDRLFPGVPHGLVFIESVRHGRFFGVGGAMPFFTTELLSDAQLGDILAYLGTPTS